MHWQILETSTHQDHVIAHVIGATVKGYFLFDETAYLLLDIGFIWNIYLDTEMGLLPHPFAVNELSLSEDLKTEIRADVDLLLSDAPGDPMRLTRLDISPIQTVDIFVCEESRRLMVSCERDTLTLETSLQTGEMKIVSTEGDNLEEIASEEEQFVRERLQEELGRVPTQKEIDEWLREHTESY